MKKQHRKVNTSAPRTKAPQLREIFGKSSCRTPSASKHKKMDHNSNKNGDATTTPPIKSVLGGNQLHENCPDYYPRPDHEWDEAFRLASDLAIARGDFNGLRFRTFSGYQLWFGSMLQSIRDQAGTAMKKHMEHLSKEREKRIQQSNLAPDILQFYDLPDFGPFNSTHLIHLKNEIEICGRTLILSLLNERESFFAELARVAAIAFGRRRKTDGTGNIDNHITNEELLIRSAELLWHENFSNPSRDQVLVALKMQGVVIRPKDQSGYFRRCKLDFLKSERGRGRPRKNLQSAPSLSSDTHTGSKHWEQFTSASECGSTERDDIPF